MSQIIRTPKFAGGGITPEEKIKLDDCAKFWIANAMSTEPVEPKRLVPSIESLAAVSNNALTQFDGALKSMLFHKSAASSASQGSLDGIDPVTDMPNLTGIGLAIGVIHWDAKLTGYELVIDYGMGDQSNITLESCQLSNFKIDPKEGGTAEIAFTLEAEDVGEGQFGKLATLKSQEVKITLIAPDVVQGSME